MTKIIKRDQHFLINDDISKDISLLISLNKKKILEIGVGRAELTKFILEQNPSIYLGIELDENLALETGDKYDIEIINNNALIVIKKGGGNWSVDLKSSN